MFTLQLTGILYYFEKHYETYRGTKFIFTNIEKIVTRIFTFETEYEQKEFLTGINTEFYNCTELEDKGYLDRFEELFGIRGVYNGYKIYVNQVDDLYKPISIDNDVEFEI